MRPSLSLLLPLALFSLDSAIAADNLVPHIPAAKAIDVSSNHITRTAEFTIFKSAMNVSNTIGMYRHGLFCTDPTKLYYKSDTPKWLTPTLQRLFVDESTKLGYPKHGANDSAFDEKIGSDADFKVGATLLDFQLDECGNEDTVKGAGYAKIKWELYSIQQQKVVFSKVVESSFAPDKSLSYTDFVDGAFRINVTNLLADPQYVTAFASGHGNTDTMAEEAPLALTALQPVKINVVKDAKSVLSAVATIENGTVSGSGFFINHDGYLLTNQHVVGGARFVKVKQADGHTQVGEVIRIHNSRDVALVKTPQPSQSALSVRKQDATVGEEVYAVGSPYGEALAGTLTHGVLSQRRTVDGISFLQSDVSVKHGNSGGPLLDANGDVIGITVSGLEEGGINMFIPIEDALEKLQVTLQP